MTGPSIIVERDVAVPMRDGVLLRADVYRPAQGGPHPVLLSRTPYDKSQPFAPGVMPDPLQATAAGYVFVMSDTRGRYASDGEFTPFVNEREDGYDTVEWAAAQGWSDGNVGMIGGSYIGYTQWMAAAAAPPHLRAIAPVVATSDLHGAWVGEGGASSLWFNVSWLLSSLGPDVLARRAPGDTARAAQLTKAIDRMGDHLPALPGAVDEALDDAFVGDIYRSWLAHPTRDAFWRDLSPREAHPRIQVPTFNVGGWYDVFLGGSLDNAVGMWAKGATEASRDGTRLIVGPWRHAIPSLADPAGDVVFGLDSTGAGMDMPGLQLRFFDRWLKGSQPSPADDARVRLFIMGENRWRNESEWPLSRAVDTPFYLRANGRLDRGRPAGDEAADTFTADPNDPVPTIGGNLCCWQLVLQPGAYDQRPVEARADVLVYSTEPLAEDVEVTGNLVAHVFVASTAPDFDVTAKLVDVEPNGFARNVAEGIRRVRYRLGTEREVLLPAGEVAEIEVDLLATANRFLAGHRIRLEIAASNWPRFDRNPQTGGVIAEATELRPARQTIFHDAAHPSRINLPIVP
jgi:putative CocE/NonD family hydrolase